MRCLLATAILSTLTILPAAAADDLAGTAWSAEQGKAPRILFKADGKVSGNASCNSFFGSYTVQGDNVAFRGFGTTRKSCRPAIMTAERAFLAALKAATGYRVENQTLQLFGANGSIVVKLMRSRAE